MKISFYILFGIILLMISVVLFITYAQELYTECYPHASAKCEKVEDDMLKRLMVLLPIGFIGLVFIIRSREGEEE